ncbi:hypothetical protein ABTE79_19325, partial [Acinetobacter baumannii]
DDFNRFRALDQLPIYEHFISVHGSFHSEFSYTESHMRTPEFRCCLQADPIDIIHPLIRLPADRRWL